EQITEILLARKTDVNCQSADGSTALIAAVFTGMLEVVRVLVEGGATVNLVHSDGFTTLMYAAQANNTAIAEILLKSKASVNCQATDDNRALTIAASYDPVVKLRMNRQQFLPRPKTFSSDDQWELVKALSA
ncbi:hypothetical protein PHMEG_00025572, partial [Phytophthora megakarya]